MFDRGKLRHFAPGGGLTAGANLPTLNDDEWLDVAVPGDVHRTLLAAGQIPDPFFDRNETTCAWMEEREWWYRLRFDGPAAPLAAGDRLQLVCHGLDTYATLWLNGEELGHHRNMFRAAFFDVTGKLRDGEPNLLAIRFDPPMRMISGKTLSEWGRNPERTPMRKAQFGYGWDWGPRLPTIGVWRPIELQRQRQAALIGVHFATLELGVDHAKALVAVRVEAVRFAMNEPLTARIRLSRPDAQADPIASHDLLLDGPGTALDTTAYLTIDRPRLWWTHDLGEPTLYHLSVVLAAGDDLLDQADSSVGIRTIALDQSPDPAERGTRFFRFVLNGVPIFARGADWIPCDSFVGAIPAERYSMLLEAARDANMTMLRIWGGGIYEHDHFYAECDRLGILVWQDFMFACAMYPEDDPEFVAEVEAEASYQVRRLRGHPCLALWCGNNENQWIHDMRFWDASEPPPYGALYYDEILPRVVAELDGRTPYWPGSPYGGNDHNSMDEGNRHNWDVWHGQYPRQFGQQPRREFTPESVSFLRYGEDRGRFVSEFGMHAAPIRETLRRVIRPDQLYHHSPALDWHNKDDPKNKGDMLMEGTTGLPGDLAEYVDFSQLAQAEGLKFGIEHYRRRKPHCSGTLVWQLNDCWPVLSWSVLDYYGFGKAGYYYLRRVYAPVLASFQSTPDGGVALWLTNETRRPIADTVLVRLSTFGGDTCWEHHQAVDVAANSSRAVCRWSATEIGAGPDRYLRVLSTSDQFAANRHFFVPIKDLQRTPAPPEVTIEQRDPHQLEIALLGQPGAYDLLVHLANSDEATRYSDNYVDLAPGERRTITVTNSVNPVMAGQLTVGWR